MSDIIVVIVILLLITLVALLIWAVLKQGGINDYTSRVVASLVSPQANNVAEYGGVSGTINHYRYTAKLRIEAYVKDSNKELLVNIYDNQGNTIKSIVMKRTKYRLLWSLKRFYYQQLVDEQLTVAVYNKDSNQLLLSGTLHVYQ